MIGSFGQSVTYNVTGYKWRTRGAEMPAVSVPECWITRRLTVKLRGRTTTPDERRGRTLSILRPRRLTTHASRPPPTMVRRHGANAQCAVPRVATPTRWYRAKPATRAANRQRHESSGLVDTCTRGRRYDRPLARSWYHTGPATCRHLHRGL